MFRKLKRLLRRKLISCYDLDSVMEPFDLLEGEILSHKNSHREVKFPVTDSPYRTLVKIFPLAVPGTLSTAIATFV